MLNRPEDVVGREQGRGLGVDVDAQRSEHPSADHLRQAQRTAAPPEGEDLLQPVKLGDARVGGDAVLARLLGKRGDETVARFQPLSATLIAAEAKAGDLETVRASRRLAGAEAREEGVEDVRPYRRQ